VSLIDLALPVRLPGTARLTLLVMVGALSYGALVALVARSSIAELRDLFATRRLAIAR
jgi:hypothetical protein